MGAKTTVVREDAGWIATAVNVTASIAQPIRERENQTVLVNARIERSATDSNASTNSLADVIASLSNNFPCW